jgi:predicted nucleic acid-binding protein
LRIRGEFLEGCDNVAQGREFLGHYIPQSIGLQHAIRCAEIQRRAASKGQRYGENDAWQIAFADRSLASIVGRDRRAFEALVW